MKPQQQLADGPAFWNITHNLKPGELESDLSKMFFNQALDLHKENEVLKQRIKRLEEELNELRSDEARLLNSNGELERRINRILEAGDKMFPWSERVGQEFWTKAKEAKL
jgi:hypothetical protein